MHVNGVVEPDQLAMLTTILEEHCQSCGIPADSLDRENLAARIVTLFMSGMTGLDDLKRALSGQSDNA
ncbi:hypothetical protein [Mesorhizobium sophorae]|uniref:hypothetical protein n=1 Tax=Mesorhizobium sophorae TaxID=1300294 RepID=UPI000BA308D7|nr:hypothetical protein [Mesorhizobium sophorae]